MLISLDGMEVYLAAGSTDLPKSVDGLAALVADGFQLDPFSPSPLVFCTRKRDPLKTPHWEHGSYWLNTDDWKEGGCSGLK